MWVFLWRCTHPTNPKNKGEGFAKPLRKLKEAAKGMVIIIDKEKIPSAGTKVIITVMGYFGNHVTMEGTVEKEPYQHGYNTKGGGWGLYDISEHGFECNPAYKFGFKQKRKRRTVIINCRDVVDIKKETV